MRQPLGHQSVLDLLDRESHVQWVALPLTPGTIDRHWTYLYYESLDHCTMEDSAISLAALLRHRGPRASPGVTRDRQAFVQALHEARADAIAQATTIAVLATPPRGRHVRTWHCVSSRRPAVDSLIRAVVSLHRRHAARDRAGCSAYPNVRAEESREAPDAVH